MSTTVLGKVSITPKGAWSAGTSYEPLDVVSYGGSAFLARRANSNVTPTEGADWQMIAEKATVGNIAQTTGDSTELVMSQKTVTYLIGDYTNNFTWEVGSIYGDGSGDYNENYASIRTPSDRKVYLQSGTVIKSTNPAIESVLVFEYTDDGTFVKRIGSIGNKTVATTNTNYYRIVLLLTDTSITITAGTISNYSEGCSVLGLSKYLCDTIYSENYVISSDFTRRKVNVKKIGSIAGVQAFCKYKNKYYSTDGSHIYVQNSSMTLEQTVDVSVGHGNSFQLGSGNIAYISGWDDQKVYCVNLDTLGLTETITLPTTGYTTVAVDDVNKLMYIFQRDSYPRTEEYYNFIVYDYENQKTISSKKTTVAFGAMQACDFLHGRILVVNGIGNEGIENGYRIYDTSGNILAEYEFPTFSWKEPEGTCIDRGSQEIIISFLDKSLYKIS